MRLIKSNVIFVLFSIYCAQSSAQILTTGLDNGWTAMTTQADPFDRSKVRIVQIFKEGFHFRCGELNMAIDSSGFDGISFSADISFVVDNGEARSRRGSYSTYLGGSDLVTDSRYYSFRMTEGDVVEMKTGNLIKVAGKYSDSWITRELNLAGFSSAYSAMCE